jgi:hypothetical protein
MADTFTVTYRKGGTLSCTWSRVMERFATREAAQAAQDALTRAGYASIVQPTRYADAVGLPVGWDSQSVNWDCDHVVYGTHETQWTSHKLLSAR